MCMAITHGAPAWSCTCRSAAVAGPISCWPHSHPRNRACVDVMLFNVRCDVMRNLELALVGGGGSGVVKKVIAVRVQHGVSKDGIWRRVM